MTDLHARLRAEVERRLAVARSATPGPWRIHTAGTGIRGSVPYAWVTDTPKGQPQINPIVERHHGGTVTDMAHIALHDPADAIRRYAGELEVLERHVPLPDPWRHGVTCNGCSRSTAWPCPEIRSLASRLGMSVE